MAALRDIWAFADLIDFRGGSGTFYPLHREMAEVLCRQQTLTTNLRENRRRMFLVPREHRKSTLNTVLYGMWRAYRNPNIRILIGTNVKDLAQEFITEIRSYFEDEELQEEVWNVRPHIQGRMIPMLTNAQNNYKRLAISDEYEEEEDTRKVVWSNWKLRLVRPLKAKEPTFTALSVGMRATGKHYDLCLLDDIVDRDNSSSPDKALKVSKWADELESVVTKKALPYEVCPGFTELLGNEIVISGTRYYAYDYYSKYVGNSEEERAELLARLKYTSFIRSIYKNDVDPEGGYLCPEIVDAEVDAELKENIPAATYYAQYHNKIIYDESASLHPDLVQQYFPGDVQPYDMGVAKYFDRGEINPTTQAPAVYLIRLYIAIDLAISLRSTADRFAVGCGGYDEKGRLFMVDLKAGRFTPTQQLDAVFTMAKKWSCANVHCEGGVGYQDAFLYSLEAESLKQERLSIVVRKVEVPRSGPKKERIENVLEPLLANGLLYVSPAILNHTPLKEEMLMWGTLSRTHDDCLNVIETIARVAHKTPKAGTSNVTRHVTINRRFGGCR